MNRQDLDGLIDAAARQMVSGEPSRSLTRDVMSRVRVRLEPAPRRFVFAVATVGTIALTVILIVMLNRTGAPVTSPQVQRPEVPDTRVVEQGAPGTAREPVRPQPARRPAANRRVLPATVQQDFAATLMPSLEPLATEAIDLLPLVVMPLEDHIVRIEEIEIEDITIEPLAASND